MSIPVPAEILLDILIKLDHPTLANVRLVSKKISQVATDILFEELSVHYGLDRSITQMRAVTNSPVRLHIHSLFIPTESFFSRGTTSRMRMYPWSRLPPKGYQQPHDPLRLTPWVDFDLVSQYELYQETLVDLLDACVNLKSIHIAFSGYDYVESETRGKSWGLLFAKVIFPKIAQLGVTKLNISLPVILSAIPLLSGYGPACEPFLRKYIGPPTEFPGLKSVSIEINSQPYKVMSDADAGEIESRMAKFLSSIPNLNSYEISNCLVQLDASPQILPPPAIRSQLTHLLLKHIVIVDDTLERFRDLIASVPSLTSLTLIGVLLGFPLEPESEFLLDQREIHSDEFKLLPRINWTDTFSAMLEQLPDLNCFTCRCLVYSYRWGHDMDSLGLLIPLDETTKEGNNFAQLSQNYQLISPYESDHIALEEFKREIRERKERTGHRAMFQKGGKEEEVQLPMKKQFYTLSHYM